MDLGHGAPGAAYGRPPGGSNLDPARGPASHVWVHEPGRVHKRRVGLLVEWRRNRHGAWEGRVVYVTERGPDDWVTVEEWLPQDRISRVELA